MKAYTDIEQSKKLLELGFGPSTADMVICHFGYMNRVVTKDDFDAAHMENTPCWSLSALLELFDNKAGIAKEYGTWFAYDNEKSHYAKHCDNPLDTAYEMVIWLKENNFI